MFYVIIKMQELKFYKTLDSCTLHVMRFYEKLQKRKHGLSAKQELEVL